MQTGPVEGVVVAGGVNGIVSTTRGLAEMREVMRRRELKRLAARMPLKPLLRFCYIYFARLGFLDGVVGHQYAKLLATYEQMTSLRVSEAK